MRPDKRRAGRAIRKQRRAARVTAEPVDWWLMFRAFGMLVDAAIEIVDGVARVVVAAVAAVAEEHRRQQRMTYRALPAKATNHTDGSN